MKSYFKTRIISFCVVILLFATPTVADGSAKSPPVTKVKSSLIREINGTTCAFLPVSSTKRNKNGLKNSWTAGSKKGAKGFVAHSTSATFYKSKGKKYQKAYRKARIDARIGSRNCRRLTALRFKTSGIIGAALAAPTPKTKSSIRSMASSRARLAVAGLYGITANGRVSSIISAISSRDRLAVQTTEISRVYENPDGSLVLLYTSHPNSCMVGSVSVGTNTETCIVLQSDLPDGFGVTDGGGFASDTTELIQFDEVGGTYVNISGPGVHGGAIGCRPDPAGYMETIFLVRADGGKEMLNPSQCGSPIATWSTLDTGGVIYSQGLNWRDGALYLWKDAKNTLLMQELVLTPNGIHSIPQGKIMILVHGFGQTSSPNVEYSQGGVLLYDQVTGTMTNWLHLRSNNPTHAIEDVFASCQCRPGTVYPSGATSNGEELFGITSGWVSSSITAPWEVPSFQNFPIAVRLYPTVTMLSQLPPHNNIVSSRIIASTKNSLVVGGPDYISCLNRPTPCSYELGIVDLSTGTYTDLVSSEEGIATLTLSAQSDGNLILAQSVRISDGQYLIGVVNETSKTITWSNTSRVTYRYVIAMKGR